MGSLLIVVLPPILNDDAGLLQRVKDLAVEKLVAQAGIEALDVAVLPRTARRDVGRLGPVKLCWVGLVCSSLRKSTTLELTSMNRG